MPARSDASAIGDRDSVLTLHDVGERLHSSVAYEEFSPLAHRDYLLLDPTDAGAFSDAELAQLAEKLRLLPLPVLAITAPVSQALARGIDVLLPDRSAADALLDNIHAHPLAAMTLVQLLRHNEDIPPVQALFAESLAFASLQGGADFARELARLPRAEHAQEAEAVDAVMLERDNDELHIVLNRPQHLNAYNTAMRDGLYDALQVLHCDASLRRAVIRGAGRCFCTGGDLTEFGGAKDTSLAHAIRSTRSVGKLLLELAPRVEFRLHRACIGSGIELPAFAARVVAHSNAFFQLPEITLGLIPGAGGTVSIPRRIGRHRTALLALSARRISARTALEWGLIDALE